MRGRVSESLVKSWHSWKVKEFLHFSVSFYQFKSNLSLTMRFSQVNTNLQKWKLHKETHKKEFKSLLAQMTCSSSMLTQEHHWGLRIISNPLLGGVVEEWCPHLFISIFSIISSIWSNHNNNQYSYGLINLVLCCSLVPTFLTHEWFVPFSFFLHSWQPCYDLSL